MPRGRTRASHFLTTTELTPGHHYLPHSHVAASPDPLLSIPAHPAASRCRAPSPGFPPRGGSLGAARETNVGTNTA